MVGVGWERYSCAVRENVPSTPIGRKATIFFSSKLLPLSAKFLSWFVRRQYFFSRFSPRTACLMWSSG